MNDIENKGTIQEAEVFEDEKDTLLEYDFDGIREFNNPPPPWLMWFFYATIIFAAYYWINMHVFKKGLHQEERYALEMERAEAAMAEKQASSETESVKLEFLTDAASISAGEELFKAKNCAACHGNSLEGNAVGPNLTDVYWIHGNTIDDLVRIISDGNIQKGMTPYKDQLSKEEIVQLASFIWSKQGSNPANAKAPQGDKYE